MPSRLCIRFLHLKDSKGEKISNVLIYIKKLSELPTVSGQSITLYETKSDSAEVLTFDNDFILSSEHEYIQVMFIKTGSKPEYLIDQTFRFNTLYNILCQSNSTKKQFLEATHTATLEQNYSLTFSLQFHNCTNIENKQKRNPEKSYRTRGHILSPATVGGLAYCSICQKLIWGVTEQGYRCAQCHLAVHFKCCQRIPFWCVLTLGDPPYLLTRNGHTKTDMSHCFEPMKRGLTQLFDHCDHCGSKVWENILKCRICNFITHENCFGYVPSLCGTKYKILDNQLRNGMLIEVFPRTSTSDAESRNSSASGSSTMSSISDVGDHPIEVIPKWSDFECIGRLGQGAFSTVYVAKHIPTNEFVTLKVVNANDDEARDQIQREKDFLFKFCHDNPYIIKLYCTFHHGNFLFLVTEFVGGDTLYQRMPKKPLNDTEIRHYLIEIISILQYLHSKHIIYRDLKLEHIVVNSEGHIRLIDYGLARTLNNNEEICETICGTPGYLAPEINQLEADSSSDGYTYAIDYWSLGIIFAQLLLNEQFTEMYTYTPNLADNLLKNSKATEASRSLLYGLLEIDKHKRLGSPLSPYGDIRQHAFFQGDNKINWSDVDEGVHKSVNKQIFFQESNSGSFSNTPLSRLTFDRNCKAEWDAIGQSKCTDRNDKQFKAFDSINFNIQSVFHRRK